ncbi:unnamed protein product [Aphanomyces euteiches]
MSCCPPNSLPPNPTKSDHTPTRVGSTDIFFYDNPSSDRLVLVFTDIYGPDSGRTKDNCVKLSKLYKVALLDLAVDYPHAPVAIGAMDSKQDVVAYFKSEHGVTKFGAMGYCMGAWIVAKYSATRGNVLSAGISFHPSWVFEHLFHGEGSGVKIAEQITVPQLILTAGNDVEWIKPGGDVDKILASRGVPSVLREFPDVLHGWVIRGDLSDPVIAEAYRAAWDDEALPFLKKFLA